MSDKLLRRPEVEARTHLSRSAIYTRIKAGTFPLPVRLGPNAVAWRAEDIDRWISELPVANELHGETRAAALEPSPFCLPPVQQDSAAGRCPNAGQHFQELALAIAGYTRHSDNLT